MFQDKRNSVNTKLKAFYIRFLKIRGTPEQISLGIALGIFIGMTPFMGFHTIAAITLASVFGWSKIAAGIGLFVTNSITAPIIYSFTYQLGSKIIGYSDPGKLASLFKEDGFITLIKSSPMIIADLLVGGAIIGIPLSIVGYYVTFELVKSARTKWRKRRKRKNPVLLKGLVNYNN